MSADFLQRLATRGLEPRSVLQPRPRSWFEPTTPEEPAMPGVGAEVGVPATAPIPSSPGAGATSPEPTPPADHLVAPPVADAALEPAPVADPHPVRRSRREPSRIEAIDPPRHAAPPPREPAHPAPPPSLDPTPSAAPPEIAPAAVASPRANHPRAPERPQRPPHPSAVVAAPPTRMPQPPAPQPPPRRAPEPLAPTPPGTAPGPPAPRPGAEPEVATRLVPRPAVAAAPAPLGLLTVDPAPESRPIRQAPPSPSAPEPPAVHVTIGRVEVRAAAAPSKPASRSRRRPKAMGLTEVLGQGSGGGAR